MISIRPDWGRPTTLFKHTWEGLVNIDQFRWMIRRDTQEQLKLAHDELGARHVRAVGMFDDEMRVFCKSPTDFRDPSQRNPRLNWQIVDYVIDSLLDIGINPMFTTTFTPGAMASGEQTCFSTRSRVNAPKDWNEWAQLVRAGTNHTVERYGAATVRNWYFEVWNEPNLSGFWAGDRDLFHQLWATTYRAIKSVDPQLRVGGPSTARAEWLAELIEFGGKNDCRPDYIITHIYNNDSESNPLSPFEGPQEDKENKSPHFAAGVVRGTRSLLDQLGFKGEVHWNEWGRSWWPCWPEREAAGEAAWVVKTMSEVSQLADYFAYWCLSDIYDQVGYGAETFHGNYGMLNLQGLRKPQYQAFRLLGMMGDQRASATIDGGSLTQNAIVTRGDKQCHVMLYADVAVTARVALPARSEARKLTLYRVTGSENNILRDWEAVGSPAYLKRDQRQALEQANLLKPAANAVRLEAGGNEAVFDLPTEGVALLVIDL
jgi:xylan 1,4-beta-xylosidase